MDRNRARSPRRRSEDSNYKTDGYSHRNRHHHNRESNYECLDFWDDRIKKRHEIMEKGIHSIWERSPPPRSRHTHSSKSKKSRSSREKSSHRKHRSHKHSKKSSKRRRRGSSCSSRSSSSSYDSDRSPSSSATSRGTKPESPYRESQREPKDTDVEIIVETKKRKPTNYIELVNQREEEEFMNELKRKNEQSQKGTESSEPDSKSTSTLLDPKDFGKALLPGEGAAMAAFVAGGKRIPRRGEIGLTSDQIEKFEQQGYVMSGSRHRRMEAVRLRKESQIYSADEKRALANLDREERAKKNQKLQSWFTQIIEAKQAGGSTSKPQD